MSDNYGRFTVSLLMAAGALLFLSYGYTEMQGSDMWWHIAAGRELLQTGTLWMVDDWSWTAYGKDWLNHEWLSDIIYYGWVSLWGVQSLVYWKWLVIISTFGILQYVLTRQTGSPLAGLVCAGLAAAIAAPFMDVRPHLYSLLMFSVLLLLLLGRRSSTWLLALLFVIWVNLHGGFFFGLMALGILLFPWRDFSLDNLRGAVLVGVICLLAAALNPSGIGTFLYPLKYAFDETSPFRTLGEWLSPFKPGGIRSPLFFTFMWVPVAGLLYLLPQVRRETGIPWEGILLTALTLAMSLTSRRFISLFAMSLAVMMAPLLALVFRRLLVHRLGIALGIAAMAFSIYRMLPYPLQSGPAFHYLVAEYSYPQDMLNYIQANGIKGKVYAVYNWGGYIHWRTDGDLKVFIDGRADTIYDAQTYNDYVLVLQSAPGWLEKIEEAQPDYILWSHLKKNGQPKLKALLDTGRWKPVYRDSVSWLLARSTLTLPKNMQPLLGDPLYHLTVGQINAWGGNASEALRNGHKTLEAIPWQRNGCFLLYSVYKSTGDEQRAREAIDQCRGYFPTAFLPR